jgi:hypothetical protein
MFNLRGRGSNLSSLSSLSLSPPLPLPPPGRQDGVSGSLLLMLLPWAHRGIEAEARLEPRSHDFLKRADKSGVKVCNKALRDARHPAAAAALGSRRPILIFRVRDKTDVKIRQNSRALATSRPKA